MIKYQETVNQSAEYLRMSLPLMSRQTAALHPVSYAIWYEYVAGINKPLTAAIDELTRDGRLLDEAATVGLYQKYIAEFDDESATGDRRISESSRRYHPVCRACRRPC